MPKQIKQRMIDYRLWEMIPEGCVYVINSIVTDKETEKQYYVRYLYEDLGCCWLTYSELNSQGVPKAKKSEMNSIYWCADFLRQIKKIAEKDGYVRRK